VSASTPPDLRVGIVGYGVMGKAHSYGYRVAPLLRRLPVTPVVTVMSARDAGAVAAAAEAYGVPVTVTDWRELISRDDVDVVDICTPPGTHAQIAQEAAAAGKAVLCEKPLALTYAEAAAALDAVTRAGVHNAVGFNYRRLPAVALMRRMIAEGVVGEVRLWRALAPVRGPVVADRPGRRLRVLVRQPGRRPARGLAGRAVEPGIPGRRDGPGGVRRDGDLGRLGPLDQRRRGRINLPVCHLM
jgi:predicted dehydrogenase